MPLRISRSFPGLPDSFKHEVVEQACARRMWLTIVRADSQLSLVARSGPEPGHIPALSRAEPWALHIRLERHLVQLGMQSPGADARPPSHEIRFVRIGSLDVSGATVDGRWKAILFESGVVTWELRHIVLDYLNGARKHLELAKLVKYMRGVVSVHLDILGVSFDSVVIPSLKSSVQRGDEALENPLIKAEWAIKTIGVVALLVVVVATSHARDRRERADALLRGWLAKCLSLSDSNPQRILGLLKGCASLCAMEPDCRGLCCHLAFVVPDGGVADDTRWRFMVSVLVHLYGISKDCPAAVAAQSQICQAIAEQIDARVENLDVESSALKVDHLRGSKRKLRVDDDYKREVSTVIVAAKRVHSGAQYLRATDEFPESSARRWESSYVLQYRAATIKMCEGCDLIWIASDASRVGQPAEETLVTMLWDSRQD